ncbi:MAG: purine nucleosidase [Saprospiraceae bacterium]|jgi:purine nucleosidase
MIQRLGYFSLVAFIVCLLVIASCRTINQDLSADIIPKLKMLIDADTANEVDDLYALARAIAEPSIEIVGITSAQFHNSPLASDSSVLESQIINQDIVRIMDREDIPVVIGANNPLVSEDVPSDSPAARFIIAEAHKMEAGQQLDVVILGSCTNVASAVLIDPSIISKIRAHYIGFWHNREDSTFSRIEFNSGNDQKGVDVLLNSEGLEFNIMTATTCKDLVFDKTHAFDNLEGKSVIGDYLVNRWKTFDRWFNKKDPTKQKWIMWDVAIIEALIHPHMAIKAAFPNLKGNTPRMIQAYTSIDTVAMKSDFYNSLVQYE